MLNIRYDYMEITCIYRIILTEQSLAQDIEWWILRLGMMVNIRINMIRMRKLIKGH